MNSDFEGSGMFHNFVKSFFAMFQQRKAFGRNMNVESIGIKGWMSLRLFFSELRYGGKSTISIIHSHGGGASCVCFVARN